MTTRLYIKTPRFRVNDVVTTVQGLSRDAVGLDLTPWAGKTATVQGIKTYTSPHKETEFGLQFLGDPEDTLYWVKDCYLIGWDETPVPMHYY